MNRLVVCLICVLMSCIPHFEGSGQGLGSYGIGEKIARFALEDQNGDLQSPQDYRGDVILLDISTMWCAPCQDIAAEARATQDDYEAKGFVYLTVLQEDADGYPPNRADLLDWSDAFDLRTPVLADGGEDRATAGAIENNLFPAVLVIDRKGVVATRVTSIDDASIRAAIEAEL